MNNKIQLIIISFLMISFSLSAQKYVQVWGDEFNTPGLPDSTKWEYEIGKIRNNELQYYTNTRAENARIEDSVLIIEARKENYKGANYTSASLISEGIGDWKYGKIEISAKVPTGKGTWPALWMMPTNSEYGGWPRSGEIDIMEYIGVEPQNLFFTVHYEGTDGSGHQSRGKKVSTIMNPFSKFIKFTLVWTPEKLEWYANDIKYHEYKKPADDHRVWPFNKKFYLILNLAYGGSWGGYNGVDDSKLPHKFLIDYVRVYQLQESDGPFSLTVEPAHGGTVEISPDLESYPEGTDVILNAIPDEGYAFRMWHHQSGANPFSFTIRKNMDFIPLFIKEGELLSNGNFNDNWNPWSFYIYNNQIMYSTSIENGMFVCDVAQTTGTDWHLGFQELGLSLKKGKYMLSFDAFAEQQKQMSVTVSKNYPDWGAIIFKPVSVTTSKQHYEIMLEMPVNDDNTRLFFGIGKFSGKFYIDNISLRQQAENPATFVNQNDLAKQIVEIYPNPTSGIFTVHIPQLIKGEETSLEMFSTDGKLLYKTKLKNSISQVISGNVGAGIYWLKFSANGSSCIKKLMVRN